MSLLTSPPIQLSLIILYSIAAAFLAVYGIHVLALDILAWRHRHDRLRTNDLIGHPMVTVQIPIYNESGVVGRVIDAAADLDWPRDRIQIQVLDDSTDLTTTLARSRVEAHRARGLDIELIHRPDRQGYKAGALANGLRSAAGEFVAVFDADFVPASDFLRRMMPRFVDDSIGFVQARWDHLPASSPFARGWAIALDGMFVVEQWARHRSGLPMIFNGSAGIWRKRCVETSGGWSGETMAEDMDLSLRAAIQGWRSVLEPGIAVPQEEPGRFADIKGQFGRWAKGGAQCSRKLFRPLLRSKLTIAQKGGALLYFSAHAACPMMLMIVVLWLPLALQPELFKRLPLAFLGIGGIGLPIEYIGSQLALYGKDGFRKLLFLPFLLVVGLGLSFNNSLNVVDGWIRWGGEWEQTPKRGAGKASRHRRPRRAWPSLIEIGLSLYTMFTAILMGRAGDPLSAGLLLTYSVGFALAGWSTIDLRAFLPFSGKPRARPLLDRD
jgi:cellulose synthase/poly-beta-1,6-N-acetylglucosamine synthase-like glycosyltransferase